MCRISVVSVLLCVKSVYFQWYVYRKYTSSVMCRASILLVLSVDSVLSVLCGESVYFQCYDVQIQHTFSITSVRFRFYAAPNCLPVRWKISGNCCSHWRTLSTLGTTAPRGELVDSCSSPPALYTSSELLKLRCGAVVRSPRSYSSTTTTRHVWSPPCSDSLLSSPYSSRLLKPVHWSPAPRTASTSRPGTPRLTARPLAAVAGVREVVLTVGLPTTGAYCKTHIPPKKTGSCWVPNANEIDTSEMKSTWPT